MSFTKTRKRKDNRFGPAGSSSGGNGQRKRFSPRGGSSGFGGNRSRRKPAKGLDPNLLIKKAVVQTPAETFEPTMVYADMALHGRLKSNLAKKGFTQPTQIQQDSLPHLLQGRDLLGIANTGTGKTAAFLIPIIEHLLTAKTQVQSIVIVPTRELALQVKEEFRSLTMDMNLYSACFIGGTSVGKDLSMLRKKNDLIIGTPGRLQDLANRGALKFKDISVLVLDEFDRMLDMGFVEPIQEMVAAMTNRKQTMLFSATLDKTQKSLIAELLHDPIEVKVNSGITPSENIEQDIIRVPRGGNKFDMLLDLLAEQEFQKVLIFAETKRVVDKVSQQLSQSGVRTEVIHGDKTQNYRTNALAKFKKGRVQVLVATDVAARGIDVTNITHVINYQLPTSFDSYVHRIGRTGRAGKMGKAFTFVD